MNLLAELFPVGRRSLLWGVHQFAWHPITVYRAWVAMFRQRPSWQIVICIVIHDWGYWWAPNMDGPEGERHPEFGARLAERLLGEPYGEFVLYHSRHYVRKDNLQRRAEAQTQSALDDVAEIEPSMLCWADKFSLLYDPPWFYLLRARLSGEIREYRKRAALAGAVPESASDWKWLVWLRARHELLAREQRADAAAYGDHRPLALINQASGGERVSEHEPTTAEERARLLDGMQAAGPHLTLTDTTMLQRLCADIDRLTAERDAPPISEAALQRLTADLKDLGDIETTPEEELRAEALALRSDNRLLQERLVAVETGAAALREAAEAAIAYDAAIQGHASEGKSWVASDNLDRLYEAWITKARDALANPTGAALLEERQRVGNILGVLMAEVEVGENVAHPTEAQAGYQAAMAKVVALLTVALQLDEPAPAPGGEQG